MSIHATFFTRNNSFFLHEFLCGIRYCLADEPNEFKLYVDSLKSRAGENSKKITMYVHLRQFLKTMATFVLFPHNVGLFLKEMTATALKTWEPVGSEIFCDHTVIQLDEVQSSGNPSTIV